MKLIIASNNRGKIAEFDRLLAPYFSEIISMRDFGISGEADENGKTFAENAKIKCDFIKGQIDEEVAEEYAVLSDDSGLCVDALGGAPGVRSARYSGKHEDEANVDFLLEKLKGESNRKAKFVCALCLSLPWGEEIYTTGETRGRILTARDGDGGFGYDPVFFSDELNKSFGTATMEEKNVISHRAVATEELAARLSAAKENE